MNQENNNHGNTDSTASASSNKAAIKDYPAVSHSTVVCPSMRRYKLNHKPASQVAALFMDRSEKADIDQELKQQLTINLPSNLTIN